jgi:hypothetical protein
VAKSGKAAGKGVTAVAITSGVVVAASVRMPLEQTPYSSDAFVFGGILTLQGLPLLPPLTILLVMPKNESAELPMNIEDVVPTGEVGVKVMLDGDADKLEDPSKVAVVGA